MTKQEAWEALKTRIENMMLTTEDAGTWCGYWNVIKMMEEYEKE